MNNEITMDAFPLVDLEYAQPALAGLKAGEWALLIMLGASRCWCALRSAGSAIF